MTATQTLTGLAMEILMGKHHPLEVVSIGFELLRYLQGSPLTPAPELALGPGQADLAFLQPWAAAVPKGCGAAQAALAIRATQQAVRAHR